MKSRVAAFAALIAFCFIFVGQAQAGPKVTVVFKNPGCEYVGTSTTDCSSPDAVKLADVRIFSETTNQSCWMTNGNRACKFENVQSGFGPKLFRFEWASDISRPAGVVDVWLDIPSANANNLTYLYDVPAHNAVFINNGCCGHEVSIIPSRTVGERRTQSIINEKSDERIFIKQLANGSGTETIVPMLDGCYTVYWNEDNLCPGNSCERSYLEVPACVGGSLGDVTTIDLRDDDNPILYIP
jgi:hypothetical protein